MFNRKRWLLLSVPFIIICAISIYLMISIVSDEPIKIYKPTKPLNKLEKSDMTVRSQGGHFHEDGTWHEDTDTTEPAKSETAVDWKDDRSSSTLSPKDPWKQTSLPNKTVDETSDTYPPPDWDKTDDPELYAQYFYAQLLKQFGDIPEVHIIGEYRINKVKGEPTTLRKYEIYLEAMNSLFPNETNKKSLERIQELKNSNAEVIFK